MTDSDGHASTQIKLCGFTRKDDVQTAVALGVDAIGFNFIARSPRRLTLEQGAELAPLVQGQSCVVALVADADPGFVQEVIAALEPQMLQFHGNETADQCERYNVAYCKAIAAQEQAANQAEAHYANARWLLMDAAANGQFGGTGVRIDATHWPGPQRPRWALAGGLDAHNVAVAMALTQPLAVDASSGIEGAVKGEKDPVRMREFVAAVRRADQRRLKSNMKSEE